MRLLPAGDRALLAEFDSLAEALGAHAAWGMDRPPGVLELVPAARTVLVRIDPAVLGLGHAEHWLRSTADAEGGAGLGAAGAADLQQGRSIPIAVHYDGEDLAVVAEAWGCTVAEVAERHTAVEWVCAFSGFAPGFPYLVPAAILDDPDAAPPLPALPRRATSRSRVPAGAVALAAEYCGIYPRSSPGGWQLIGRTDVVLWDAGRAHPALIAPGDRVRFVPASTGDADRVASALPPPPAAAIAVPGSAPDAPAAGLGTPPPTAESPGVLNRDQGGAPTRTGPEGRDARLEAAPARSLHVLDPGPRTLVQDLGRPGLAALGVGAAGAMDRAAHRLANRLVGNPEQAATLEVLLGGLVLALPEGAWIAVTGGTGPVSLDGRPVAPHAAVRADRDGAELRLGPLEHGLRAVVAVRGGVDAPATLGSRSRDSLAELGPRPLEAGQRVPLGPEPTGPVPSVDLVPIDPPTDGAVDLAVRPGPRRDWFEEAAWSTLLDAEWTVSARSDRTGLRLDGPALARDPAAVGRELPSEGMLPGSIQVSPDGAPTVLGPDAPVTGGYPVIAVLTDAALDLLAQLRPGQPVRLRLATGRR
ncbi:5-oxoprolinase/urea amidolyase family protein [Microcella daejeonensis]|uniref:5-oxoprolinase/urea amidolyase family protein n=1 Tax=Microcella daejeonensis TaxID=2994971 RepID=A0A9E8MIT8_9MICO|nr:5-oxoprolinase/urea amidolyase family protein [Microcella daejeonensis]WAB80339.1 5-oxoprolinase/urea amidolyase family protein [Microcella daejeonensis]